MVPNRRNVRQRTIAGLLALLAQAGVVGLFMHTPVQRVTHEAEPVHLVFIQPMQLPAVVPPPPERTPTAAHTTAPPAIISDEKAEPVEATVNSTITVPPAPRIDWYTQMAEAIRSINDKAAEELRDNPLNSKPRVLELPDESRNQPAVTSHMNVNGELTTEFRINKDQTVVCRQGVPLMAQFDVSSKHIPPSCFLKGQKKQPDFKDIRPRYLRKPLPVPDEPRTVEQP